MTQVRTQAQLIEDFNGTQPEQLKLVNLIVSLFAVAGDPASKPEVAALEPVAEDAELADVIAGVNAVIAALQA